MPSPDRNFANSAIFTQTTTGTTPNAGDNSLYFKSDSNIYSKNSSGTEIQISGGTAGGDLSGSYPNPTVDGLQGRPVSNAAPVNGQVLQYDGANWVPGSIPSGGSGGGGVLYYLNFNTAADAPLTNIPQTPNASKELGISGDVTGTIYTSPTLSTAGYDFLASFVTDVSTPSSTTIPAGIWDLNTFVQSSTTNAANQVYFKIEICKYNGVNAPVLLATSNDTYIYDPTEVTQYVSSVVMPQTTILSTDRIVVYLYGRAHQNNNTLTFHFGGNYPSHTHTTIPSVTGTGVAKVVNGVFQSPASTIVNADVASNAAIAVSKLSQATDRILGRTTAGTGAVEEITVGTGLSLSAGTLSNTVSGGVTSVTGTSPIASSGGATPAISISDAAADGTTKGAAAFNASDFNATAGVISIDYTNGQAASTSAKGFLTSTDWNTFNNKGSGTVTSVSGTLPISSSGGASPTISIAAASTTVSGAVQLTDSTSSTSTTTAATPNSVKSAYDLANGKAGTAQANTFSQPQIITGTNDTTAMLRITQEGQGEAIRVEDSATPDSTAFVVNKDGRVGIGTAPDATVALKLDSTGVKFNDGTVQTTAGGVDWTNYLASVGMSSTIIENLPRNSAINDNLSMTAGTLYAVMLTPVVNTTISQLSANITVAGISATLFKLGIYTYDESTGAAALVASTASDISKISAGLQTLPLLSSITLTAGVRYAFVILQVGGNAPSISGVTVPSNISNITPVVSRQLVGQTDLQTNITISTNSTRVAWIRGS